MKGFPTTNKHVVSWKKYRRCLPGNRLTWHYNNPQSRSQAPFWERDYYTKGLSRDAATGPASSAAGKKCLQKAVRSDYAAGIDCDYDECISAYSIMNARSDGH